MLCFLILVSNPQSHDWSGTNPESHFHLLTTAHQRTTFIRLQLSGHTLETYYVHSSTQKYTTQCMSQSQQILREKYTFLSNEKYNRIVAFSIPLES